MDRLSDAEQQVVLLRYSYDMSLSEIAELTGANSEPITIRGTKTRQRVQGVWIFLHSIVLPVFNNFLSLFDNFLLTND
jgi:hypothetical protein